MQRPGKSISFYCDQSVTGFATLYCHIFCSQRVVSDTIIKDIRTDHNCGFNEEAFALGLHCLFRGAEGMNTA